MSKIKLQLIVLFLIGLSRFSAFAQYGDLPSDKIPPGGWPDLSWVDPGGWTTVNVNNNGLPANDNTLDASIIVKSIVDSGSGRRIIKFPEGNYYFKTSMALETGNIRLVGDGDNKTKFILDGPSSESLKLSIGGSSSGVFTDITSNSIRGSQTISVSDASNIQVNDFIELTRDNVLGQVVWVTGKSGNVLTLDMKLGVDFGPQVNGKVQKLNMAENVGVEKIQFRRLRRNGTKGSVNMAFPRVFNGYIKECFSRFGGNVHFSTGGSRNVFFSRNRFHSAFDYGGGGNGYGIAFGGNSTRIYVFDNKAWNLRHHIILANSANHAVVAYNSTDSPNGTKNDIIVHGSSAHNNLFESNMCVNTGSDQRSDPNRGAYQGLYNTYFRNKVSDKILGQAPDDVGNFNPTDYIVVGNIVKRLDLGAVLNRFVGLNRVKGIIKNGALNANSEIPNSLYADSKPTFLGNKPWPLFGPGVTDYGSGNTLPAADRSKKIGSSPGPGPGPSGPIYEAENLGRTSNGATTSLGSLGTWVNLNANGNGPWVEFTIPNVSPGTYDIEVDIAKFNNGGVAQTSVEGSDLGGTVDFYSNGNSGDPVNLGSQNFSNTGDKKVRFTVIGKNAASTGFKIAIDKIILTPTGSNNGQLYRIENKSFGRWIKNDNGTNISIAATSNTGNKTQWIKVPTTDGYFRLESESDGKWLKTLSGDDVGLASQTNTGARIEWREVTTSDGYVRLENRETNTWLQGTETNSVRHVANTNGGTKTEWKFIQVPTSLNARILSLENSELVQSIQIYPNPSSYLLHIKIHEQYQGKFQNLEIYDMHGRKVVEGINVNIVNHNLTIPIATLPPGNYVIKAMTKDGRLFSKLFFRENR